MSIRQFKDDNLKNQVTMIEIEDFEYVNPILKTYEMIVGSFMEFSVGRLEFLAQNNIVFSFNANELVDTLVVKSKKRWDKYLEKIQASVLPSNLLKLLEDQSKNNQLKLLKGVSLNSSQLMKFVFQSWEKANYSYSFYTSVHNHNGIDDSDLPEFVYIEDNKIFKIGKTKMSDGEIRNAIAFKKRTIAKFIDNNDSWHCFFYNSKSIAGKERGWQNEPHIHYISDKWGVPRDEVLFQLKNKNYKLPSNLPHINFTRTLHEKLNTQ